MGATRNALKGLVGDLACDAEIYIHNQQEAVKARLRSSEPSGDMHAQSCSSDVHIPSWTLLAASKAPLHCVDPLPARPWRALTPKRKPNAEKTQGNAGRSQVAGRG